MAEKSLVVVLSAMLLSASAMAGTGNLLTNGSLDSGSSGDSPDGWNLTGDANWTTSKKYSSSESDYFVKLVAKNSVASLTQTFATVAGMSYTVSFDYDSKGGSVFFGVNNGTAAEGNDTKSFLVWDQLKNGRTNYRHASYTFKALSDVTTLGVVAASQGAKVVANSFSVAAVPEPASVALFMAGLGALGLVSRRRRVK